jgi:hypothetical protein
MKKIILFVIVAFLFTSNGCKKYEEGPWLSLRSAKRRLEHKRKIVSYQIDNVEEINTLHNAYINFYTYDNHSKDGPTIAYFNNDSITKYGSYYFADHNKILKLNFHDGEDSMSVEPFLINSTYKEWTILRLTYNDLWLECDYNNQNYLVKAENIN